MGARIVSSLWVLYGFVVVFVFVLLVLVQNFFAARRAKTHTSAKGGGGRSVRDLHLLRPQRFFLWLRVLGRKEGRWDGGGVGEVCDAPFACGNGESVGARGRGVSRGAGWGCALVPLHAAFIMCERDTGGGWEGYAAHTHALRQVVPAGGGGGGQQTKRGRWTPVSGELCCKAGNEAHPPAQHPTWLLAWEGGGEGGEGRSVMCIGWWVGLLIIGHVCRFFCFFFVVVFFFLALVRFRHLEPRSKASIIIKESTKTGV